MTEPQSITHKIAKKSMTRASSQFPSKLKAILNSEMHRDCICWNDDGTKIILKNKEELGRTVLPLYFKSKKVNTFIRQLNLFSFRQISDQFNNQVYYHQQFTRDQGDLQISRKRQIPETLTDEHHKLQLQIYNLVSQQCLLQQQIGALIKFNNKISIVQSNFIRLMQEDQKKSKGIESFIVRNILSFGKGLQQSDFGNKIIGEIITLIDELLQDNNMYLEESISFFSETQYQKSFV